VRTPALVVGNWKMNTTLEDARALVRGLLPRLAEVPDVEVVVCPPFPWLVPVAELLAGSAVKLGAQNLHTQDGGAYTGEVSGRMLAGLCQYVLVGPYERRIYFGDKDAIVRQKLLAAYKHGLRPILCVGETADQLDEGTGGYVVASQLEAVLEETPGIDGRLVVAYEPVWTTMGLVAPPPLSYVGDMCSLIRETLGTLLPAEVAQAVRVLYGGQVSPRTIGAISAEPRIDGVLSGAASVNAENFATLVRAFAEAALPRT
jgi:triosephosphate isomerase